MINSFLKSQLNKLEGSLYRKSYPQTYPQPVDNSVLTQSYPQGYPQAVDNSNVKVRYQIVIKLLSKRYTKSLPNRYLTVAETLHKPLPFSYIIVTNPLHIFQLILRFDPVDISNFLWITRVNLCITKAILWITLENCG